MKGKIYYLGDPTSVHLTRWANEFFRRGWDCSIFTFNSNYSLTEELNPRIKVYYIPEYVKKFYKGFKIFPLKYKFINLIKNENYDIFHIHSIPVSNGNIFFKLLKNLVISVWGTDIIWDVPNKKESFRRKLAKRVILESADIITSTSYFMLNWVKKYIKKEKEIYVIPFGVDLKKFRPEKYKKKRDKTVKIYITKLLRPKYGIDILIKAFSYLCKELNNIELHIIGEGPLKEELINLTKSLSIDSKVKFWGYIKHSELPEIISQMDIFVMPSISESFGVAAIEASAMKIPVVASNIGGVPEVVIHNKTGFLFKPGDIKELEKYLKILITNKELREKMGIEGRKFVLDKYNWEKNVDEMEKLYYKILDGSEK